MTAIALVALRVRLSMFPLSALLLICDVTISSPRESRYRCLELFFFCCQLEYSSIHGTNAFTQATSIKLRNSSKGEQLVYLIQVYSHTSLSRTSTPLLRALECMTISGLWSLSSPMHVSAWCYDERRMAVLFLAGTYDTSVRSLENQW